MDAFSCTNGFKTFLFLTSSSISANRMEVGHYSDLVTTLNFDPAKYFPEYGTSAVIKFDQGVPEQKNQPMSEIIHVGKLYESTLPPLFNFMYGAYRVGYFMYGAYRVEYFLGNTRE